jgi:hypothetical protein
MVRLRQASLECVLLDIFGKLRIQCPLQQQTQTPVKVLKLLDLGGQNVHIKQIRNRVRADKLTLARQHVQQPSDHDPPPKRALQPATLLRQGQLINPEIRPQPSHLFLAGHLAE